VSAKTDSRVPGSSPDDTKTNLMRLASSSNFILGFVSDSRFCAPERSGTLGSADARGAANYWRASMAEGVRFELTRPLRVCQFSRLVP
jgi:hypothetical protein